MSVITESCFRVALPSHAGYAQKRDNVTHGGRGGHDVSYPVLSGTGEPRALWRRRLASAALSCPAGQTPASTPSIAGSSRASARSGESPPATRPALTR